MALVDKYTDKAVSNAAKRYAKLHRAERTPGEVAVSQGKRSRRQGSS